MPTWTNKFTSNFGTKDFTLPNQVNFVINIRQKDYGGLVTTFTLANPPVIHEWQDDDPFATIKGSTLKINIISDENMSLETFYSNEDDTFLVELYRMETLEMLFQGYILQDDCREIQVDFKHVISITASDNLGLIKDVSIDQAAQLYGQPTGHTITISTISGGYTFYSPDSIVGNIKEGQQFTVSGGPYSGIYTAFSVEYDPILFWKIYVAESLPNSGSWTGTVIWDEPVDLSGYISLLEVVRLCFKATQLDLGGFNCVSTLFNVNAINDRLLDDTYIRGYSLKEENRYLSCYEVLEKLMLRFKASAFQAYGEWWIVRWGELYFQAADISTMGMKGIAYNSNFETPTSTSFTSHSFTLDIGDFEYGLEKSVVRPIRYTSEQFNYKQIVDIFKNIDLTETGDLLNQYPDGSNTVKEYALPYWELNTVSSPLASCNLTKIYDNTGDLVDSYIKLNGPCFAIDTLKGPDVEVTAGDKIKYSFDVKSIGYSTTSITARFRLELTDGTTIYHYNSNNSTWSTGFPSLTGDIQFTIFGDTAEWNNINVETAPVPIDGILNIFVGPPIPGGSYPYDAAFKNFTFNIIYEIGGSKLTSGHIHKDTNPLTVKNIDEKEIYFDDTKRSTINGTLFTGDTSSNIRIRTTNWQYDPSLSAQYGRLGYLTTLEQMMINHKVRSKYDGTILKLWQGTEDNIRFISNFFVFNVLDVDDNRRFVPGSLSIDYRNSTADITLHQITEFEELPEDVDDYYTFNYIYENS